jgi:hypothetical protein
MGASIMSYLLVCSCGKQWMSESSLAVVCPDCGHALAPVLVGGWRSLWPRLALAAAATLCVVIACGIVVVRFLPAPPRETLSDAAPATNLSSTKEEIHKPSAAPDVPAKPLLVPPTSTARPMLPLLDNPSGLAPPLESPSRTALPEAQKPLDDPAKNAALRQAKDEFFQHLVISRVSRYRILDLDLGQNVQYVLVSRFRVKKKNDDGSMTAEQKVESVRLTNADPALQDRLNDLLQKTKGATFTMTLNAHREVTKFEGGQEALKVIEGDNPLSGPTFLLWSFLDRDGWKELAQLSFFQPPPSKRRGERWERPLTHSWGPLGNWSGKIHFQSTGKLADSDRYDYLLNLAYQPPRKSGGLPFEIGKSQFQIETARGVIAYQPNRGRIAAAEERFHVRGVLAVSFLGAESSVQMDEMQLFQLRIVDKNPLEP